MSRLKFLFAVFISASIALTQFVWACPPTGHHLGVILKGSMPSKEVLQKLRQIGIDARTQLIRYRLSSGNYVFFETVLFKFGDWLPSKPTEEYVDANARLYLGERNMVLKVNTSLHRSTDPLKKAIALLYLAGVIDYFPNPSKFVLTEGNKIPADVVVEWAEMEYGYQLEQLILRCRSPGRDVISPSLSSSQDVVVVANKVDEEVSYPTLKEGLSSRGLSPTLIGPELLRKYLNAKFLIILGGPDAYDGVGNISSFFLQPHDSAYLRSMKGSYIVYMSHPTFKGQRVFVLAGNDRYGTKKAVETFVKDLLDDAVGNSPLCWYEFSTTQAYFAEDLEIKEYPCSLFIRLLSTLPNPCYKPLIEFEVEGKRIEVTVKFVQLPVFCIQVISTGDLRIYMENLLPGEYELIISAPQGRYETKVKIPACWCSKENGSISETMDPSSIK